MIDILRKKNIVPSTQEKYNATAIRLVVKTEIGSAPTISCVVDKVKYKKKCYRVSLIMVACLLLFLTGNWLDLFVRDKDVL